MYALYYIKVSNGKETYFLDQTSQCVSNINDAFKFVVRQTADSVLERIKQQLIEGYTAEVYVDEHEDDNAIIYKGYNIIKDSDNQWSYQVSSTMSFSHKSLEAAKHSIDNNVR